MTRGYYVWSRRIGRLIISINLDLKTFRIGGFLGLDWIGPRLYLDLHLLVGPLTIDLEIPS